MSTELRNVPDCTFQNELTQTRFWGGKDRMTCVQVTQRRNKNEGKRGPADEFFNSLPTILSLSTSWHIPGSTFFLFFA